MLLRPGEAEAVLVLARRRRRHPLRRIYIYTSKRRERTRVLVRTWSGLGRKGKKGKQDGVTHNA